jgi:hypothetical protein
MAFRDLTPAQLEGYRAKRLSLADLASAAGITVQAVSQALQRRSRREARQKAAGSPGTPAGISAPPFSPAASTAFPGVAAAPANPDDDLDAIRIKIRHIAGHAALDLLGQIGALARGEDAHLGATAVKASVTALSGVLDALERLQIIDGEGDANEMPELRIAIMSPDRSEEIRRQSEEGDAALDLEDTDEIDRPGIAGVAPDPAGNSRRVATPESVLSAVAMPALPANFDLAARLSAYGDRHGAVALRVLALAVGAPAGRSADALVTAIVERACKDREAMAIACNAVLTAP